MEANEGAPVLRSLENLWSYFQSCVRSFCVLWTRSQWRARKPYAASLSLRCVTNVSLNHRDEFFFYWHNLLFNRVFVVCFSVLFKWHCAALIFRQSKPQVKTNLLGCTELHARVLAVFFLQGRVIIRPKLCSQLQSADFGSPVLPPSADQIIVPRQGCYFQNGRRFARFLNGSDQLHDEWW